jgi:hypothetical protein
MSQYRYLMDSALVNHAPEVYAGTRIPAGAAALSYLCPCCATKFLPGDYVVRVPLGPGDDPIQRERAKKGEPFVSRAILVHLPCANGRVLVVEELGEGVKTTRPAGGPEVKAQLAQAPGGDPR